MSQNSLEVGDFETCRSWIDTRLSRVDRWA